MEILAQAKLLLAVLEDTRDHPNCLVGQRQKRIEESGLLCTWDEVWDMEQGAASAGLLNRADGLLEPGRLMLQAAHRKDGPPC